MIMASLPIWGHWLIAVPGGVILGVVSAGLICAHSIQKARDALATAVQNLSLETAKRQGAEALHAQLERQTTMERELRISIARIQDRHSTAIERLCSFATGVIQDLREKADGGNAKTALGLEPGTRLSIEEEGEAAVAKD